MQRDGFVTSFEAIGRMEGQRDLIVRQLNRKVGQLDAGLRARVAALDPDVLLTLSEALLDVTHQADLVAWLDQPGANPTT